MDEKSEGRVILKQDANIAAPKDDADEVANKSNHLDAATLIKFHHNVTLF